MSQVRASHILVEDEQTLKDVQDQISNGTDFGEVAKNYSKCPSGQEGGDLGWFGQGMMVKAFEDACYSMELNEVSPPVKTQFGWHLIKLTGKK